MKRDLWEGKLLLKMPAHSLLACALAWSMLCPQHLVHDILSCCETSSYWSEKYFDLLHCRSNIQNVCYEFTVRFAQDHGRLTGWHYLHWRSIWEWENKRKNDEECREKENQGGARSSPQHPIINSHPKDQKDLVTRRSERPKDPVSTLAQTYSFS